MLLLSSAYTEAMWRGTARARAQARSVAGSQPRAAGQQRAAGSSAAALTGKAAAKPVTRYGRRQWDEDGGAVYEEAPRGWVPPAKPDYATPSAAGSTRAVGAKPLAVKIAPGARTFALNMPETMNALDAGTVAALRRQLLAAEDNPAVEVIVLQSSSGKVFSGGVDFSALWHAVQSKSVARQTAVAESLRELYALQHTIRTSAKPVVVASSGLSMGAGVALALNARASYGTAESTVAFPEASQALTPVGGSAYALSRMGNGVGMYLALTGGTLSGEETLWAGVLSKFTDAQVLAEHGLEDVAQPHQYAAKAVDMEADPQYQRNFGVMLREDKDVRFSVLEESMGEGSSEALARYMRLNTWYALWISGHKRAADAFLAGGYQAVGMVDEHGDELSHMLLDTGDKDAMLGRPQLNEPNWMLNERRQELSLTALEERAALLGRGPAPLTDEQAWKLAAIRECFGGDLARGDPLYMAQSRVPGAEKPRMAHLQDVSSAEWTEDWESARLGGRTLAQVAGAAYGRAGWAPNPDVPGQEQAVLRAVRAAVRVFWPFGNPTPDMLDRVAQAAGVPDSPLAYRAVAEGLAAVLSALHGKPVWPFVHPDWASMPGAHASKDPLMVEQQRKLAMELEAADMPAHGGVPLAWTQDPDALKGVLADPAPVDSTANKYGEQGSTWVGHFREWERAAGEQGGASPPVDLSAAGPLRNKETARRWQAFMRQKTDIVARTSQGREGDSYWHKGGLEHDITGAADHAAELAEGLASRATARGVAAGGDGAAVSAGSAPAQSDAAQLAALPDAAFLLDGQAMAQRAQDVDLSQVQTVADNTHAAAMERVVDFAADSLADERAADALASIANEAAVEGLSTGHGDGSVRVKDPVSGEWRTLHDLDDVLAAVSMQLAGRTRSWADRTVLGGQREQALLRYGRKEAAHWAAVLNGGAAGQQLAPMELSSAQEADLDKLLQRLSKSNLLPRVLSEGASGPAYRAWLNQAGKDKAWVESAEGQSALQAWVSQIRAAPADAAQASAWASAQRRLVQALSNGGRVQFLSGTGTSLDTTAAHTQAEAEAAVARASADGPLRVSTRALASPAVAHDTSYVFGEQGSAAAQAAAAIDAELADAAAAGQLGALDMFAAEGTDSARAAAEDAARELDVLSNYTHMAEYRATAAAGGKRRDGSLVEVHPSMQDSVDLEAYAPGRAAGTNAGAVDSLLRAEASGEPTVQEQWRLDQYGAAQPASGVVPESAQSVANVQPRYPLSLKPVRKQLESAWFAWALEHAQGFTHWAEDVARRAADGQAGDVQARTYELGPVFNGAAQGGVAAVLGDAAAAAVVPDVSGLRAALARGDLDGAAVAMVGPQRAAALRAQVGSAVEQATAPSFETPQWQVSKPLTFGTADRLRIASALLAAVDPASSGVHAALPLPRGDGGDAEAALAEAARASARHTTAELARQDGRDWPVDGANTAANLPRGVLASKAMPVGDVANPPAAAGALREAGAAPNAQPADWVQVRDQVSQAAAWRHYAPRLLAAEALAASGTGEAVSSASVEALVRASGDSLDGAAHDGTTHVLGWIEALRRAAHGEPMPAEFEGAYSVNLGDKVVTLQAAMTPLQVAQTLGLGALGERRYSLQSSGGNAAKVNAALIEPSTGWGAAPHEIARDALLAERGINVPSASVAAHAAEEREAGSGSSAGARLGKPGSSSAAAAAGSQSSADGLSPAVTAAVLGTPVDGAMGADDGTAVLHAHVEDPLVHASLQQPRATGSGQKQTMALEELWMDVFDAPYLAGSTSGSEDFDEAGDLELDAAELYAASQHELAQTQRTSAGAARAGRGSQDGAGGDAAVLASAWGNPAAAAAASRAEAEREAARAARRAGLGSAGAAAFGGASGLVDPDLVGDLYAAVGDEDEETHPVTPKLLRGDVHEEVRRAQLADATRVDEAWAGVHPLDADADEGAAPLDMDAVFGPGTQDMAAEGVLEATSDAAAARVAREGAASVLERLDVSTAADLEALPELYDDEFKAAVTHDPDFLVLALGLPRTHLTSAAARDVTQHFAAADAARFATVHPRSVAAIMERLRAHDTPWARDVLAQLHASSPLALAVTHELLVRAAAAPDWETACELEWTAFSRLAGHPDFAASGAALYGAGGAGVSALHKAGGVVWAHSSVQDVPGSLVNAAFEPLPASAQLQWPRSKSVVQRAEARDGALARWLRKWQRWVESGEATGEVGRMFQQRYDYDFMLNPVVAEELNYDENHTAPYVTPAMPLSVTPYTGRQVAAMRAFDADLDEGNADEDAGHGSGAAGTGLGPDPAAFTVPAGHGIADITPSLTGASVDHASAEHDLLAGFGQASEDLGVELGAGVPPAGIARALAGTSAHALHGAARQNIAAVRAQLGDASADAPAGPGAPVAAAMAQAGSSSAADFEVSTVAGVRVSDYAPPATASAAAVRSAMPGTWAAQRDAVLTGAVAVGSERE